MTSSVDSLDTVVFHPRVQYDAHIFLGITYNRRVWVTHSCRLSEDTSARRALEAAEVSSWLPDGYTIIASTPDVNLPQDLLSVITVEGEPIVTRGTRRLAIEPWQSELPCIHITARFVRSSPGGALHTLRINGHTAHAAARPRSSAICAPGSQTWQYGTLAATLTNRKRCEARWVTVSGLKLCFDSAMTTGEISVAAKRYFGETPTFTSVSDTHLTRPAVAHRMAVLLGGALLAIMSLLWWLLWIGSGDYIKG
jgi:hypothetical protein